jgi:hypothetical protein
MKTGRFPVLSNYFSSASSYASSLNKPKHYGDNGNNEQDVYQPSGSIPKKSDGPANDQYNRDSIQ